MPVHVRQLASPGTTEVYITATPSDIHADAATQAAEIFAGVVDALKQTNSRIVQERVLFAPGAKDTVVAARLAAYGDVNDGVDPAWLQTQTGGQAVSGAQIYAVTGDATIELVEVEGVARGRIVRSGDQTVVLASGLVAAECATRAEQTRGIFLQAEQVVGAAGGDLFDVARTWMWLTDLLEWYDEFNDVRNALFTDRGLLGSDEDPILPASTGISLDHAEGAYCTMDLLAVLGKEGVVARHQAGGEQGSAYDYGSAFSRAVTARTLAGKTVLVSGTAAIDEAGYTEHLDDIERQISDTIHHARAILADGGCGDADVVHAIMYCKTPEVELAVRRQCADLVWPQIIAVCDVCRHDLLFETELTACVPNPH
jgi:enamine deaminase RidA (YjgF/YER057c/UK114 family)